LQKLDRHAKVRSGNERAKFPRVTPAGSRLIEQAIPLVEQVDRHFFERLKSKTRDCLDILKTLSLNQEQAHGNPH
jgi:DNA-binding MarR family transcriptional regulator